MALRCYASTHEGRPITTRGRVSVDDRGGAAQSYDSLPRVNAAALRAEFSVLTESAYLNSGTCGPLPRAAVGAAGAVMEQAARDGRGPAYMKATVDLRGRLRAAYAGMLGADAADLAVTTSTSEGIVRVLAGLELGPGDEVLTAPDEHPGLLGPLASLRARRGVEVRTAPFAELADAAGPRTRLVACSHVSWVTGAIRPDGLAALGADIAVLLDGAQGVGAVPTDVHALGCDFYAGSGQKWMCGPVGTGMLWVSPAWRERLAPAGATYMNLAEPSQALDGGPLPDARRHDAAALAAESTAAALAAHEVLAAQGWAEVHRRARTLAGELEQRLGDAGRTVAPRDATTLVSWEDADPVATRDRLAAGGVVIRNLPGTRYLRASVGAWNDEGDLERLLAALAV
jgi:selenocysteine lyase/cysteine desulfurase